MKKFRLKKEAIPFFSEKYATKIMYLGEWEGLQVDIKALEEVEEAHISYGINSGKDYNSLAGWSAEEPNKGSHFCFTIHFPSMTFREHDVFTKGRTIRSLMDNIQQEINGFYEKFGVNP